MAPKLRSLEEAFLLLGEQVEHSARNPNIKHYKPHEKQAVFHKSPKKKKLYIGGNRSGKTTGGVCEDIWRATCRHPYRPDLNAIGPNRGRVIAVDFINGVEGIIFPQFKQWLYPSALINGSWEDSYDKTLRTLTFANTSTIQFMSYDQDLDKFAGTSRHWIHFDEEPPQSIYIENMARLIDTDGDFWITMTPVEGMTWVHDDLYESNADNPDGSVEVIEIDMLENPYLKEGAIKSFMDSIDEDERQSRIAGKFVQIGGRIYKQFDPTPGGHHVLAEPIEHPKQRFKDWLWVVSLDHGLSNPTAVLWSAVNTKGEIVTFNEHYQKDWTIDKHAARIHEINRSHGRVPDLYIADPSIQNRNPVTGTSIHEEYIKFGIPFVLGNNDVAAGIIRTKRYLNVPKAPTGLGRPANLKPKWQCTPNCVNLIWELKRYRWKTFANKKLRSENNNYEVPHKKDDHAADALRYMIMSRPDLSAEAEEGFASQVMNAMPDLGVSVAASPVGTDNSPELPSNGWSFDEHMGAFY